MVSDTSIPRRSSRRIVFVSSWLAMLLVPATVRAEAGPTIEHQPMASVPAGSAVTVQANITSNTRFAVATPSVYVHVSGTLRFTRFAMNRVEGTTDLFRVTIPAEVVSGDFDYYLEAFDEDDNGPSRQGDEQHPLHVKVVAPVVTPPPSVAAPRPQPDLKAAGTEVAAPAGGLTAATVPAPAPSHTAAYALLGVGGACLVVAGVLTALSLSTRSTYLTTLSSATTSQLASEKETSEIEAGIAWGALSLGLTGISVGGYQLLSAGSRPAGAAP